MIPIRDHNPSSGTPIVTWVLIAANVLIFLSYAMYQTNDEVLGRIYYRWALIPAFISEGRGLHGLVTSMFLHAGFVHLGGNMLFLWIFGDNLEADMGHVRFAAFYLGCGIAAGLAQVLAAPYSPVPTVGASGAIAGVMGGYMLLYPRARVDVLFIFIIFFKIFPIPAWIVLGVWFGLQLMSGTGADMSVGGVAYWAHVGGFLAGMVLTIPVWTRRGGRRAWLRNAGRPDNPEARYRFASSDVPIVRRGGK